MSHFAKIMGMPLIFASFIKIEVVQKVVLFMMQRSENVKVF
jgi:hypothetical protein